MDSYSKSKYCVRFKTWPQQERPGLKPALLLHNDDNNDVEMTKMIMIAMIIIIIMVTTAITRNTTSETNKTGTKILTKILITFKNRPLA